MSHFNKSIFLVLFVLILCSFAVFAVSISIGCEPGMVGLLKQTINIAVGSGLPALTLNDCISDIRVSCTDSEWGEVYTKFFVDANYGGDYQMFSCGAHDTVDTMPRNFNDVYSSFKVYSFTSDQSKKVCGDKWTGLGTDQGGYYEVGRYGPSSNSQACCDPGDAFIYSSNAMLCYQGIIYGCGSGNILEHHDNYYCNEKGWKEYIGEKIEDQMCADLGGTYSYSIISGFSDACCGDKGIVNPGFENDLGWDFGVLGKPVTTKSHSGSKSVKAQTGLSPVPTLNAGRGVPSEVIAIQQNKNYTISGWIYRNKPTTGTPTDARIAPFYDAAGNDRPCEATAKMTNQWEHVSCVFNSTTHASVRISAAVFSAVSADVYFDDIHLIGPGMDIGSIAVASENERVFQYICNYDVINSKWIWKDARTNAYKIIPIDNLFDSVSNSENWTTCNPNNIFNYPKTNIFSGLTLLRPTSIGYSSEGENNLETISAEPPDSAVDEGDLKIIPEDETLAGVSREIPQQTSTEQQMPGTNAIFTITPDKILRDENIILSAKDTPLHYLIKNNTKYNISVSNGNDWLTTKHRNSTSYEIRHTTINNFEIDLPRGLEKGTHNLNITFYDSTTNDIVKSFIFTNAFEITEESIITSTDPYFINPKRYYCYKTGLVGSGVKGAITECCGPTYNYCNEGKFDSTRVSGGPTGLLKDYYGDLYKNSVLRVKFPPQGFTSTGVIPRSFYYYYIRELPITNWNIYDYLEFDVLFAGNKTPTGFAGSNKLKIMLNGTDDSRVFENNILQFSTTGSDFNKWHHIKIPLDDLVKRKGVKSIKFFGDPTELAADYDLNPGLSLNKEAELMIFYLDRILLTSNETMFCSTDFGSDFTDSYGADITKIGEWVNDLDKERDACNAVASYEWISNDEKSTDQVHCCGDDQNSTNSESFYDEGAILTEPYKKSGCWRGEVVKNDSIVVVNVQK